MLRSCVCAVILVACLGWAAPSRGQQPAPKAPAPAPPMVPDPYFDPVDGVRAAVLRDGTIASATHSGLLQALKHRRGNDPAGIGDLVDRGTALILDGATPLLVVKVHREPSTFAPGTSFSPADFGRQAAAGAMQSPADPGLYPTEARVLAGPHKDRLVYLLTEDVGRLVPARGAAARSRKATGKPEPPAARAKAVDPDSRAADSLRLGENLLRAGNRASAIEYFRRAVLAAPGSDAAAKARARLAELGAR